MRQCYFWLVFINQKSNIKMQNDDVKNKKLFYLFLNFDL